MKRFSIPILSLLVLLSCKQNYVADSPANTSSSQARPVQIETLSETQDPLPIEASGLLGSEAEMNLSFKIGGIISRMNVEEGRSVRKGQVLASLRTTEIDAQVVKAKQGMEKAERDLGRIQGLYADSAATLEQVQNLQTAYDVAKADYEIASFNQSYARIVAPARGRILKRFTESNELVNPGTPIFRLASDEGKGFIIQIGVADRDVIRIKMNDRAEVRFDAYPGKIFPANVSEIAEAADPQTGTFEIELQVDPTDAVLKNGFVGKVRLFPSNEAPYLKISLDALVEGSADIANLYVPNESGSLAIKKRVRPLHIGDGFFTIDPKELSGFPQVITQGAAYLKEGDSIRIVSPSTEEILSGGPQ